MTGLLLYLDENHVKFGFVVSVIIDTRPTALIKLNTKVQGECQAKLDGLLSITC